jgi:hypothetical protein
VQGFVEKNAIMEKVFLVVVSFYPTSALPGQKSVSGIIPMLAGKRKLPRRKRRSARKRRTNYSAKTLPSWPAHHPGDSGLLNIGLEATVLERRTAYRALL